MLIRSMYRSRTRSLIQKMWILMIIATRAPESTPWITATTTFYNSFGHQKHHPWQSRHWIWHILWGWGVLKWLKHWTKGSSWFRCWSEKQSWAPDNDENYIHSPPEDPDTRPDDEILDSIDWDLSPLTYCPVLRGFAQRTSCLPPFWYSDEVSHLLQHAETLLYHYLTVRPLSVQIPMNDWKPWNTSLTPFRTESLATRTVSHRTKNH